MKQIDFPMSALGIMQECLKHYNNPTTYPETYTKAAFYLDKIEMIIKGEAVSLTSQNFLEIHSFVISIYSSLLDSKGTVTDKKWTDSQWRKVLEYIEYYYGKDDTYKVTKR